MKETDVRERAFSMPLTSPAYRPGPSRFRQREYLIITYRTDAEKLRALVPEPLEVTEPIVKYEFIRMPDSTGFGDYTESGQVIPVSFRGRRGGYTHCMFLNDYPPIAGGRNFGASRRSSGNQRFAPRSTHWWALSIMGRCGLPLAPWVTSTRRPTRRQCWPRSSRPTSCSRSSPMWMAARAFASWSNTISRISNSKVHGLDPALSISGPCFGADCRVAGARSDLGHAIVADLTLGLGKVVYDYLRTTPDTGEEPCVLKTKSPSSPVRRAA
jgi:acetoacetate decarboxylase